MSAYWTLPCHDRTRDQDFKILGSVLLQKLPQWISIDEHRGEQCLGNDPRPDLPRCSKFTRTNCVYQVSTTSGSEYQGSETTTPSYRYQDLGDQIKRTEQFMQVNNFPRPYDGPVDGTIGGQDLRNLPPVHVSAIPYNFGDTFSGQNNLKLLSRVGGHASTATTVSNINQGGVGFGLVSSFYGK